VIDNERDQHWPDCLNVRDLGGLPTRDGGAIRPGALIRADALNRLTDEGIAIVRAAGVSRILDLRRETETGRAEHPFATDPVYRNIPVQNPADPDHEWLTLAGIYCAMLDCGPTSSPGDRRARRRATRRIVVHCAGGKDRTGMVVALALSIAGVADEVIAADYALTEERVRQDNRLQLELIDDPRIRAIMAGLQPTPPAVMLETLAHLQTQHGGVRPYLATAGISDLEFTAIVDRLMA